MRSHYKKKKKSRSSSQLATTTETSILNFCIDRSENIRERKKTIQKVSRIYRRKMEGKVTWNKFINKNEGTR